MKVYLVEYTDNGEVWDEMILSHPPADLLLSTHLYKDYDSLIECGFTDIFWEHAELRQVVLVTYIGTL